MSSASEGSDNDRFNWIVLTLEELEWGRDEELPPGRVQFTAVTDGRMIGVSRYFLNSERNGFDTLYVEPEFGPCVGENGNFVGRWLVGNGYYQGNAGVYNQCNSLFYVEDGVIVRIVGVSSEALEQMGRHMLARLAAGDQSVVPTEQEALEMQRERERPRPRLRVPGEFP